MYPRVGEKRRIDEISEDDIRPSDNRLLTQKSSMEHEKRIRREIANSNERRRMQSINAGFSSLKSMLPKSEGEKLSKASILQSTATYLYQLEQEKTRLLSLNSQLKRVVYRNNEAEGNQSGADSPEDGGCSGAQMESFTTLTATSPEVEELQRELKECKAQLERERSQRMQLEELVKQLKQTTSSKSLLSSIEAKIKKEEIMKPKSAAGRSFLKCVNKDTVKIENSISTSPEFEQKEEPQLEVEKIQTVVSGHAITLYPNHQKVNFEAGHAIISPSRAIVSPNGTILTLLSSKPVKNSPVIEVHGSADELATVSNHESTIDEDSTLYIMNPQIEGSNVVPTKNLDTICEAIRHLEGDKAFPEQHDRLEEEVITEETYTIEEEMPHQDPPQISSREMIKLTRADTLSPLYASTHNIGGSISNLTLRMCQEEPQEVPLELTTHRSNEQQYPVVESSNSKYQIVESKSLKQPISTSSQTIYSQTHSRPGPGVITVLKNNT